MTISTPPADTAQGNQTCFSTHQDWPHLTENQEGSQLYVFTIPILQRNSSKSCSGMEKQCKGKPLVSDLSFHGVPRNHMPSSRSREVSAPCWGWLSGSQRSCPDKEELQNAALTNRTIQRSEVKNGCHLEMPMIHSEASKTHRTLHIEFRVAAAVVQFLK